MTELLSAGQRIVLTGGPGSGKTTVLLYIACVLAVAIAEQDPEVAEHELGLRGSLPLPVFIPLSAYAARLRALDHAHTASVAPGEVTLMAFARYYLYQQLGDVAGLEGFPESMVGRTQGFIFLLDGLDEVPNERERLRVRQAVENLVVGNHTARAIVSCRTAAHRGRTALGRGFREAKVKRLDTEHLLRLVEKTYRHMYSDVQIGDARMLEVVAAIMQLEGERQQRLGTDADPLIDSPLMLRLLFIAHQDNERLPAGRVDLYLMATDALLRPDYGPDEIVSDAIGGMVGGDLELHRKIVTFVAFQLHNQGQGFEVELSEFALRAMLEGEPWASGTVDDVIGLTRLRGSVMEERLGQYRFLHLAFQEFLTARYLAETVMAKHGVEALVEFLESGPVVDSWWREPILLLFAFLISTTPRAASLVMTRLVSREEDWADEEAATRMHMAVAEIVGAGVLEWPSAPDELTQATRERLAGFFSEARRGRMALAPPRLRVGVGVALGVLGDCRQHVNDVDYMEMCFVADGPVELGSDLTAVEADGERRDSMEAEGPPHVVDIPYAYWMGRHPVTNGQFAEFCADGGYDDPTLWEEARALAVWKPGAVKRWYWSGTEQASGWEVGPHRYGPPFDLANHPIVGICWYEALAFSRWLTARLVAIDGLDPAWIACLPSEPEWEKAARGGLTIPSTVTVRAVSEIGEMSPEGHFEQNPWPRRRYPWGDDRTASECNDRQAALGSTSAIGCFPDGSSPYGCEDMSGNVWEWTRSLWGQQHTGGEERRWDLVFGYPYDTSDGREDLTPNGYWLRVARGGAYFVDSRYCRVSFRDQGAPSFRFPWDGFRLAVVPKDVSTRAIRTRSVASGSGNKGGQ